jgi:hypothetical protein
MEVYRAEFTLAPIFIGFLPGCIFFPLILSLEFGLVGFLSAGVPLLLLLFITIAAMRRSAAIVFADTFEFSTSLTSRSVRRIEASKIESVDFRESLIGRSRWGSVTVRGAGLRALKVNNVKNPEKLAEALRSVASSPTSKKLTPESSTTTAKLQELNELFRTGVLSQQEFDKAKSKILDL